MNKEIESYRDFMEKTMKANFEKDGFLAPVFFFVEGMVPTVVEIPNEVLAEDGKVQLMNVVHTVCSSEQVACAGLVIEAWARDGSDDDGITKLLLNGSLRISQLNDKNDIIMLIFATPEKEECISYIVDPKTKTILKKMTSGGRNEGRMSNLFKYRK